MHQIQVIIDWGGFAVNTWYFTLQNLSSEFCSILHYMHCFYWNLTNSLCYNSLVWLGRTARFLNQAALLRNPVKSSNTHYQMPNCDLHSTMFLDFIRDHNDITTVHQSLVFPVFLPFIRVYHDIHTTVNQSLHLFCVQNDISFLLSRVHQPFLSKLRKIQAWYSNGR